MTLSLLSSKFTLLSLWIAVATSGLAVVWSTHETRSLINELLQLKSEENAMLVAHGQYLLQASSLSSPVSLETLAKETLGLKFPEYSDIQVLSIQVPEK